VNVLPALAWPLSHTPLPLLEEAVVLLRGGVRCGIKHALACYRQRKKVSEQGSVTFWRGPTEGQVRAQKEGNRARVTHLLKGADGGINQDSGRK